MTPRIETAEILKFKLKIARADLEAMPGSAQVAGLNLALAVDNNDLILSVVEGDSHLRFRSIGTEVILTEVQPQRDERGLFFHRVLGPLMVRFAGDLQAKLCWNDAERNTHGDHSEVRISRGQTTYPGLSTSALLSASGGSEGHPVDEAPSPNAPLESPSPEEQEVQKLLSEARAHFAEYQRLKNR